jgi:hypothetical protein
MQIAEWMHGWIDKSVLQTVKLPQCNTRRQIRAANIQLYSFLTSALDGGNCSASRLTWVCPRICLDSLKKGKILCPLPGMKPRLGRSIAQPGQCADWGVLPGVQCGEVFVLEV